jgi:hypothetical protein
MTTMNNKAYTAGHFVFQIDDHQSNRGTAWVKSVDGGAVKASVITENTGPAEATFRHLSTVEVEPITVEVGLAAAKPILQWIQHSWERKFSRRNGAVVHADFKYKSRIEQWFTDALIAEVGFPALDASQKESAYLSVKLHPERLEIKKGDGNSIQGIEGANKAKMWLPSMFEVDIDGIDCTGVNKVESFTVKQSITQMYLGADRYAELEPTGIEFPTLTLSMAEGYAQGFIDWHQEMVIKGVKDPEKTKTGHLHFLAPFDKNKHLFSIELTGVGINSLVIEKSDANAEGIKRVKVELYLDAMKLELAGGDFEAGG